VESSGAGMEKNHAWCLLCVLPGPGSSQDSREIQERGYAALSCKDKCSDGLVACGRDNVTADAAGRIGIFPFDLPELPHDAADSG
jgi:hypothetical protein